MTPIVPEGDNDAKKTSEASQDRKGTDDNIDQAGRSTPGRSETGKVGNKKTDSEDRNKLGEVDGKASATNRTKHKSETASAKIRTKAETTVKEEPKKVKVPRPRCPICGENRFYDDLRGQTIKRCRNCGESVTII